MKLTMRPTRIAELVAERLWKARGEIEGPTLWEGDGFVDLSGGETALFDGEYHARLTIPGDIRIEINSSRDEVGVQMNGHATTLDRFDAHRVIRTWRAVQASAILQMLDPLVDLDMVQRARGGDLFERITAPIGNLLGYVPVRWPGQNVAEELDERIAEEITLGRYERTEGIRPDSTLDGRKIKRRVAWHRMRDGISFVFGEDFALDGDIPYMIVSHPEHGHARIVGTQSLKAFKRCQSIAFSQALEHSNPIRTMHLPQTGNARIARIARICREALTADPEMRDSRGTPLLPLVQHHLPDLLRRHAAAARNAPAESLTAIDDDLEKGVDIIRTAVDDGLRISTDARMADLREQLRFLEGRHPGPDAI